MIHRFFFELRYLLGDARWDTGVSPPELIDYLREHPPGRALDVGCGTGTNSMTMAGFGWSVLGIDVSTLAVHFARRKARLSQADVHFKRCDFTRIGAQAQPFDFVLDLGCLHTLPRGQRSAYKHILRRSTTTGSDYLLYTWLKVDPDDALEAPTESELRDLLHPEFELTDLSLGSDHEHTSAWLSATRFA